MVDDEAATESLTRGFNPVPVPILSWQDEDGAHQVAIGEPTILGSSARATVVAKSASVSRVHVELTPVPEGLWVHDLGSLNGTWVGDLRVDRVCITRDARLRFGALEASVSFRPMPSVVQLPWPTSTYRGLVGSTAIMRTLFSMIERVGQTESAVLVLGETGTGKEGVARALHEASSRADKPFVIVDCAALAAGVVEAELFGHVRGAFTGATSARIGHIEAANGGTIFLDEVGDLPLDFQPKLLRALEAKSIRRVGENVQRSVDVRVISATHRDLAVMVGRGEFREDLYFRLGVIPIRIPPLRDRQDDIDLLTEHFLQQRGALDRTLSASELIGLRGRAWRGNVRELRNFVERIMALGTEQALELDAQRPDAPSPTNEPDGIFDKRYRQFREEWIDRGEQEYIRRLLARHDRNVQAAADDAGVDRTYIYRLIRRHSL